MHSDIMYKYSLTLLNLCLNYHTELKLMEVHKTQTQQCALENG